MIQVQRPMSVIRKICMDTAMEDVWICLTDAQGKIRYAVNDVAKTTSVETGDLLNPQNDIISYQYNPTTHRQELVARFDADDIGLHVYACIPKHLVYGTAYSFVTILCVICAAFLSLTFIVALLLERQLNAPLKAMRDQLEQVSLDNFTIELDGNSSELVEINRVFANMFIRLQHAIEEKESMHLFALRSQMQALQAQMDPHFIYNILSVISSLGQDAGSIRIMKICRTFSDMLNYCSGYVAESVTLEREITHMRNYVFLMTQRYEENIRFCLKVAEDLSPNRIHVPKMILQPLVENCFKHGFSNIHPPWVIEADIALREDYWFFVLEDNGSGISEQEAMFLEEKASQILSGKITSINMDIGGLGILSSVLRTALLTQNRLSFEIGTSRRLGGTRVVFGGYVYEDSDSHCGR